MSNSKIKEGSAKLTKPDNSKFDLQFICGRCQRVSIWTNYFIKHLSGERTMQCENCGYSEFWIRGVETY